MVSVSSSHPATTVAKSLAIIVADDVAEILRLVGQFLEGLGHTISYASSGTEVIRLLARQACDLAIVDVLMPDGDGLDVVFAVKRSYPSTRVLAISGGGKYMVAGECLRVAKGVGAEGILLKPFNRAQLLAAIDAVMNRPREAGR